jgi:hypothetical protein
LQRVGTLSASLDSIELLCWSTGCWNKAAITTVAVARTASIDWWPPFSFLDEEAKLAELEAFLECNQTRRPVTPRQQQVWNWFYQRYYPLVRQTIATCCRCSTPAVDLDDLCQEVWMEIATQLLKLTYSFARGSLSTWLVG